MSAEAAEVRIDVRKWAAIGALGTVLFGVVMALGSLPGKVAAVERRQENIETRVAADHELLVRIEENQKRTLEQIADLKSEVRRQK